MNHRTNYNANERPATPEEMKTAPGPPRGYLSPIYPLAYRRILQLQIMMPTLYLSVAQLIKLMEYFPPDEGYLRILLIQSVFSHVVDLELMYQIYDNCLTPGERMEVKNLILQFYFKKIKFTANFLILPLRVLTLPLKIQS